MGYNPRSILISVVLPAPFAPRSPKISPFLSSKSIQLSAINSPNFLVRHFAFTIISGTSIFFLGTFIIIGFLPFLRAFTKNTPSSVGVAFFKGRGFRQ